MSVRWTRTAKSSGWGDNSFGQSAPPVGTYSAISAGWGFMCAVAVAGEAACWGDDRYGQTDAPPGAFAEIASGARHSCGLREDGQIACWGGQFGR